MISFHVILWNTWLKEICKLNFLDNNMTPEVKTWRTIVNIKSIINENEKFYNPFASGLCLHKESSQIVLGNDLIKIGKKIPVWTLRWVKFALCWEIWFFSMYRQGTDC